MKGLYVHIPFCLQKCKYCDFNSFTFSGEDKKKYLAALFREMEKYKGSCVDSVFVGGGTPTALNTSEMKELLLKIRENFSLSADCEFTVEANPKTVDADKLDVMLSGGVNRLSVGVQSFTDTELARLGRVHTAAEAKQTITLARKRGFKNISIDLMCAIPGQTAETFRETLAEAFAANPEHISCYSLILEENTPLYEENERGLLNLPNEDEEREIYEIACRELEKNGYAQYEISNFAKKGFESRHNKKYWECGEYIGLGLSAHSYLDGARFSNTESFSEYTGGHFSEENAEILGEDDKMSEFMFMGLRMVRGVSETEFFRRFGKDIKKVYSKQLSKFIKMGMIEEENGFFRLTHEALSVSNQIMCEFII